MARDRRKQLLCTGNSGAEPRFRTFANRSYSGRDRLPILLSSLSRLREVLNAPAINLRELVEVVWSEPCIAARVLCGAVFENAGQIPVRMESVLLVGAARLKEIVCSATPILPTDPCAGSVRAFNKHCMVVSLLSEKIAASLGDCCTESAAIMGLLHHADVGAIFLGWDCSGWLSDCSAARIFQVVDLADQIANCCGCGLTTQSFPHLHTLSDPLMLLS